MDFQKALVQTALIALAAGGAWFLYDRAEAAVEIAVPARDLPAYTSMTEKDLRFIEQDPSALPADTVLEIENLIGRYTREPLSAGRAVLRHQVVPREEAALPRARGTVAVSLAATAAMAYGGRLRPGEEVAVWILLPPPGQQRPEGRRLLDRALVLDVLPVPSEAAEKKESARYVIVLAVPVQRQAEVLAAAAGEAIVVTRVP